MKKVGLTSEFPFGIYWWTLKNPKDHNFEKGKKIIYHQRYHRFTHMYQKPQSYEVQFLRYEVRQNFLSFWALFCPFNLPCPPPLTTQEKKILKNRKKYLDRYGMQWTIFCHFRPFFALLTHYWPLLNHLEVLSFYTCLSLWWMDPEI